VSERGEDREPVTILLNGQQRSVRAESSVASLVEEMGLDPGRIAIELDREILPRKEWTSTLLRAGASVEIVHFVGGG
jgi:thiamine biosynthesis protein ThiS